MLYTSLFLKKNFFFFLNTAAQVAQWESIRLPMGVTWETWARSLGREDPLEKEMATLSSSLAWRIPWVEEPAGLQSIGSRRVGHVLACRQALLTTSTLPLPWFFLLLSTPTHMLVHKKGVLLELHVNLLKTQQSK